MNRKIFSFSLAILILFSACSRNHDSSARYITGQAAKGFFSQAKVVALLVNEDNSLGDAIAETRTQTDGNFSLHIAEHVNQTIVVKLTADEQTKMICDTTAGCLDVLTNKKVSFSEPMSLPENFSLQSIFINEEASDETHLNINVFTNLATDFAFSLAEQAGVMIDKKILAKANAKVSTLLTDYRIFDIGNHLLNTKLINLSDATAITNALDEGQYAELKLAIASAAFMKLVNAEFNDDLIGTIKKLSLDYLANGGELKLQKSKKEEKSKSVSLDLLISSMKQETIAIANLYELNGRLGSIINDMELALDKTGVNDDDPEIIAKEESTGNILKDDEDQETAEEYPQGTNPEDLASENQSEIVKDQDDQYPSNDQADQIAIVETDTGNVPFEDEEEDEIDQPESNDNTAEPEPLNETVAIIETETENTPVEEQDEHEQPATDSTPAPEEALAEVEVSTDVNNDTNVNIEESIAATEVVDATPIPDQQDVIPPGHTDSTPGNNHQAPGHTGETPGKNADAAGHQTQENSETKISDSLEQWLVNDVLSAQHLARGARTLAHTILSQSENLVESVLDSAGGKIDVNELSKEAHSFIDISGKIFPSFGDIVVAIARMVDSPTPYTSYDMSSDPDGFFNDNLNIRGTVQYDRNSGYPKITLTDAHIAGIGDIELSLYFYSYNYNYCRYCTEYVTVNLKVDGEIGHFSLYDRARIQRSYSWYHGGERVLRSLSFNNANISVKANNDNASSVNGNLDLYLHWRSGNLNRFPEISNMKIKGNFYRYSGEVRYFDGWLAYSNQNTNYYQEDDPVKWAKNHAQYFNLTVGMNARLMLPSEIDPRYSESKYVSVELGWAKKYNQEEKWSSFNYDGEGYKIIHTKRLSYADRYTIANRAGALMEIVMSDNPDDIAGLIEVNGKQIASIENTDLGPIIRYTNGEIESF